MERSDTVLYPLRVFSVTWDTLGTFTRNITMYGTSHNINVPCRGCVNLLLARIRGTTTETGLSVTARWNRRRYRTKEKVSKEEQKLLRVHRHKVVQRWNYTIKPKRRNN